MVMNWLEVGLLLHPPDDPTAAKIAPGDPDLFYKSTGISMEHDPGQPNLAFRLLIATKKPINLVFLREECIGSLARSVKLMM